MEIDAVGIGVSPTLGADEVESFGVGLQGGQDIRGRSEEREFDGSGQSHNMIYYRSKEIPLGKSEKVLRKEDAGNSSHRLKTGGFPCQNGSMNDGGAAEISWAKSRRWHVVVDHDDKTMCGLLVDDNDVTWGSDHSAPECKRCKRSLKNLYRAMSLSGC